MVKRQNTLKKKVSKRQTRKLNKKGGRKQQKINGGAGLRINTPRREADTEKLDVRSIATLLIKDLNKTYRKYNQSSSKLEKKYNKLIGYYEQLCKENKIWIVNVLNESNKIIFRKNMIKRNDAINDIRGFLLDCNKDKNGKVILKTSKLGWDYIYNKFSIEKREDKLYLVMKHESGEQDEIEIKPTKTDYKKILIDNKQVLIDEEYFVMTTQVYNAIEEFLNAPNFKGQGDKDKFLENILKGDE